MASVQAIVSCVNGSIATPVQDCSAAHAPGAKGPGLYGSTEGEGHLRKRIPKAKAKPLMSWCPELQTRTPQPKAQGARSSATMQTFLARFERLRSRQRLLVGQVETKAHSYTALMKYQAGPQNHSSFAALKDNTRQDLPLDFWNPVPSIESHRQEEVSGATTECTRFWLMRPSLHNSCGSLSTQAHT